MSKTCGHPNWPIWSPWPEPRSRADEGTYVGLPHDETHPLGYGRVRDVYAFLAAVVLFTVGGLFAVYEGYEKIKQPHELESAPTAAQP